MGRSNYSILMSIITYSLKNITSNSKQYITNNGKSVLEYTCKLLYFLLNIS